MNIYLERMNIWRFLLVLSKHLSSFLDSVSRLRTYCMSFGWISLMFRRRWISESCSSTTVVESSKAVVAVYKNKKRISFIKMHNKEDYKITFFLWKTWKKLANLSRTKAFDEICAAVEKWVTARHKIVNTSGWIMVTASQVVLQSLLKNWALDTLKGTKVKLIANWKTC